MKCNGSSCHVHCPRPGKVGDLPDSVCPVFLDKMQEADLSSLPRRLPSRPALTRRALRCLAEVHTTIQTSDTLKEKRT